MSWVWSNFDAIWNLTLAHIGLSVIPIIVGFIVSIPLGYFASRSQATRTILLTTGGVLYTIPSLALFLAIPAVLGTALLDPINVVIALTVYAVALMLRTATEAFTAVSAEVQDSATAIGFSRLQRFFAVDFPLAGPVLLAGVRVVSVSTVSLVSIGAVIGTSSLGSLFTDGFQRYFFTEIWVGLVGILIIAIVFDLILVTIARILLPWNRRLSPALALIGPRRLAAKWKS